MRAKTAAEDTGRKALHFSVVTPPLDQSHQRLFTLVAYLLPCQNDDFQANRNPQTEHFGLHFLPSETSLKPGKPALALVIAGIQVANVFLSCGGMARG
jgi:hypothetical protein